MQLTEHESAVLDLEREAWKLSGRKENEGYHARFAISASSYYRALHTLIERPEAMAYDPLTVLRLHQQPRHARRYGSRVAGRIRGADKEPRRSPAWQNVVVSRPPGEFGQWRHTPRDPPSPRGRC